MNTEQEEIVREELWRSVAWLALGMVGWPVLVTEFPWLEQNVFTVFGLPVITWAVLTAGMIAIRTATGRGLQLHTSSRSLFVLEYTVLAGVSALYLVEIEGYSPLLVIPAEIALGAGLVAWYWYTGAFDSSAELTG